MKGPVQLIALALTSAVLASCASNPVTYREDGIIVELRDTYVREHPGGLYNQQILEGRIEKGMGIFEVLASWGLPDETRVMEDDLNYLCWTYSMVNRGTRTAYTYRLKFRDYALVDWDISRAQAATYGSSGSLPNSPPDAGAKRGTIVRE